ncbi:MAG: MBL fold metallo-hydrolase [Clostridia bacterium]|nr:MBL fold metallo-hydrolase [Clostridia bacterium]
MLEFEKINDEIFLLRVPFSTVWTGVIIINDTSNGKNYLIDSSNDNPEKFIIPALGRIGIKPEDIDYLLNTHCHGDHIGGHSVMAKKYGIKVATYANGAARLENPAENAVRIRTKFPNHSPNPQSWLKGVKADIVLEDGEVLGNRLKLIHTPGHDDDCVCWYDLPTRTVISGDSIQANGTPTQGIGFYQSLDDYMKSLDTLCKYDIENIIAGHDYDGIGDVIIGKEKVSEALSVCRDYVKKYDKYIREKYNGGETDAAKIAVELINEMGCGMPKHLFLALYTVTEHIRIIREGKKI